MIIEIARDTHANERTGTVDLISKIDGELVVFAYADRAASFRGHRALLKRGALYISTTEEDKRYKWSSARRI